MKDMYFLFGEYKFPNKVDQMISYLKEKEIEHYLKEDSLEFYTKYNGQSIIWTGILYKERICSLNGRCRTLNKEVNYALLDLISTKYQRDSYNKETEEFYFSKIPTKNRFVVKMLVNIKEEFVLTVWFEDEKHKPFKDRQRIEDFKDAIGFTSCGLIGIGLAVLFILSYIKNKTVNSILIMSFCSYFYMVGSIFIYNVRNRMDRNKNICYSLILPLVYIIIVFLILFFLNINNVKNNVPLVLDLLAYSILSMPAFILVIAVIFLFIILLSFAG